MDERREIRVVETATGEVVRRMDVTGKGDRHVERAMSGVVRQMDGDRFHVEDSADDEADAAPPAPGM